MSAAVALFATPIPDGSLLLHRFIWENFGPLKKAGGEFLTWRPIGHPASMDEIHKRQRTEELRRRDDEDAAAYESMWKQAGSEEHYFRQEYEKYAADLGVADLEAPLIVFWDRPEVGIAVLPINPEALDTPRCRRALLRLFRERLAVEEICKFRKGQMFTTASLVELDTHLAQLANEIDAIAAGAGPSGLQSPEDEDRWHFRRHGKLWMVGRGPEPRPMNHAIGMQYITILLRNPNQNFHAADLRALAHGEQRFPLGSAGEVADEKTKEDLQKRREDLQELLAGAQASADPSVYAELAEEEETINAALGRMTGLAGRPRLAADDRQRAAQSVSKAVRDALKRVKATDEAVWRHLYHSLSLGAALSYQPEHPPNWIL
jgi:hypothetical protein